MHRDHLPVGHRHGGPLVIEEDFATTVIPPDASVAVDSLGLLQIRVRG